MTTRFIKNILLKVFINIIFLFPIIVWGQETPPKSVNYGWAIHLGAGIMYGGNIGLLIEKQIHLNEKFRVSPFVAVGVTDGGTDSISNKKYYWFSYSAGANLEYGKKHRIVFGPHFMGNNLLGNSVNVKKKFRAGASFIIGYKGTADFGLIWQIYIGDIYSQDDDPFSNNKTYSHRSHFGLGLGYKF